MIRTVLLTLFVLTLLSSVISENLKQRRRSRDKKIVKGEEAKLHEFPYQAVILLKNGAPHCGGSIIHQNFILTAAHCYLELYDECTVAAGINDYFDFTSVRQEQPIMEMVRHENYIPGKSTDDVALIYVEEPFKFNKNVKKIQLSSDEEYPSGIVTLTGWGNTVAGNPSSNRPRMLQKATFSIAEHDYCKDAWKDQITKDTPVFCYGETTSPKSGCHGDSGGPLVQYVDKEVTQIGVVNFGNTDCTTTRPGVALMVSHYRDWIDKTMEAILGGN